MTALTEHEIDLFAMDLYAGWLDLSADRARLLHKGAISADSMERWRRVARMAQGWVPSAPVPLLPTPAPVVVEVVPVVAVPTVPARAPSPPKVRTAPPRRAAPTGVSRHFKPDHQRLCWCEQCDRRVSIGQASACRDAFCHLRIAP